MDDFQNKLSEAIEGVVETNRSLKDGVAAQLEGLTVTRVINAEVWSCAGECSFEIELSDGTILECPGVAHISGPAADLFRMAGGDPTGGGEG